MMTRWTGDKAIELASEGVCKLSYVRAVSSFSEGSTYPHAVRAGLGHGFRSHQARFHESWT